MGSTARLGILAGGFAGLLWLIASGPLFVVATLTAAIAVAWCRWLEKL
jgi:hypothetical protein